MKDIKAGIVGLGLGQFHLDVYDEDPRIGTVDICDTSPEVLERTKARSRKVRGAYTSLESTPDKRWQIERFPRYGTHGSGRPAITGRGIHGISGSPPPSPEPFPRRAPERPLDRR